MIYLGTVMPSIMEEPINQPIMAFLEQYEPQKIELPTDAEQQKKLKTQELTGVISGEMKALVRKNENLLSRDCLLLDLDDVVLSESELVKTIKQKFKKFDYVLYPTISHGVKGVRYRLVLPLSESVKEQDYKLLISFLSNQVLNEVIREIDQSNGTWSQIQLLPVLTQYVAKEQLIFSKGEELFPVKEAIKGAKQWANDQQENHGAGHSVPIYLNAGQFKKGASRYRNTTTELFESLVAGCEEGNRNNRIAQITGGLLVRAVDVALVLALVQVANQHFSNPLSTKEVEATFYSIAKKELGANE